jgi:hypothetical protein
MRSLKTRCRLLLGAIVGGSVAYLLTTAFHLEGDAARAHELVWSLTASGACIGALGFKDGVVVCGEAMDAVEDTFWPV